MDKIIIEDANAKWKIIADNWEKLGPTAKPSMEEIEVYKAVSLLELADKEKINIAICGSTPELRDMCYEYLNDKVESVTCVDATEDMYSAMSSLVKSNNPKERFIHGNWLELSKYFEKESVDIVYGDHIVSNVGGKEKRLFDEIKTILKKDGCFASKIHHVDITDERIKNVPAYEKLKDYAFKYKEGKMNLKTAFTHFGLNLLFSSYHLNNNNEMSFAHWGNQIDKLDEQASQSGNKYEAEILDMCHKIWWNWREVKWTQYEKTVMHKILEDNFFIKDEVKAPGHEFSRQTSIYRLKKI
jgi:SAM-dependent methyltransferase